MGDSFITYLVPSRSNTYQNYIEYLLSNEWFVCKCDLIRTVNPFILKDNWSVYRCRIRL